MVRSAKMRDLQAIAAIETSCFPTAEAATEKELKERLSVYPNHFWVLEQEEKIIAFVDGMVTNEPILRDEMYENPHLHNEHGDWQMIFGVNTLPAYRKQGYAAKILEHIILEAKSQGRKGIVLTCKDKLIHYYETFGFENKGVSESVHGGVIWYNMRLTF